MLAPSLSGARNKKSLKAALEGVDGGVVVRGVGGVGAGVSLEASAEAPISMGVQVLVLAGKYLRNGLAERK